MKTLLTTATAALALLGACTTPTPICDREAQEWSKFGTQEDICTLTPSTVVAQPIDWDTDDDRRENPPHVTPPTPPQDPTSPPVTPPSGPDDEPETPTPPPPVSEPPSEPETPPSDDGDGPKRDKPKGDNSDANGKGGNKHDRDDFTHGGTEVAEGKKG